MENKKKDKIDFSYNLNNFEPYIYFKNIHFHYNIIYKNIKKEIEEKKNLKLQGKEIFEKEIEFLSNELNNHDFYFSCLIEPRFFSEEKISKELFICIEKNFKNLEILKEKILNKSLEIKDSGWIWVILEEKEKLNIVKTNYHSCQWNDNFYPLIGIDLWEHSYYFDYGPEKEKYVNNLINNLINWEYISNIYHKYISEKFS